MNKQIISIDGQDFELVEMRVGFDKNAKPNPSVYALRPITIGLAHHDLGVENGNVPLEDKPEITTAKTSPYTFPVPKPEANKIDWVVISKSDHDITIELKTLI